MPQTISARSFNQDISGAKRLAKSAPVIITDREKPAFVLMTHDEYLRLTGKAPSIVDMLDHPPSADFEFEFERMKGGRIRTVDFD